MPRKPRVPRKPVDQQQSQSQQPGEVPPTVTPWAKVLNDWIWAQFVAAGYRPIGPSQLAARLGYPRQTVSNWLYRGFTPSAADMFHVMTVLDIPLARLAEAYAALGLEFPTLGLPASSTTGTGAQPSPGATIPAEAPGPRPRAYQPPPSSPTAARAGADAEQTEAAADEWEQMVTTTTAALREAGVPEEAIILAVARIRERQAGLTPFAQRLAEEKSEGGSTSAPASKSSSHTSTRKPSPSVPSGDAPAPRGGGRSTTPSGSPR